MLNTEHLLPGNEVNMTLYQAINKAREQSKEGYVQHVNKTEYGYSVSDWYDSDTTVYSFEDGIQIFG